MKLFKTGYFSGQGMSTYRIDSVGWVALAVWMAWVLSWNGGWSQRPDLSCNDSIQVSLAPNGIAVFTLDMAVEGAIDTVCWDLVVKDQNNRIVSGDTLTCAHIGQIMTFEVHDTCTGNSCWGTFWVEDKYIEPLVCSNDTVRCSDDISPDSLGFPLPPGAVIDSVLPDGKHFLVDRYDSCGLVRLWYEDTEVLPFDCDVPYKVIVRKWKAVDPSGNMTMCRDSIFIHLPNLLEDTVTLRDTVFWCDDTSWVALPNGNPSPESTGWPIVPECSTVAVEFSDQVYEICGATKKILRKWTLVDWCVRPGSVNDSLPRVISFYQRIKILDDKPPIVYCPTTHDVRDTIGMKYYECSGDYVLPVPEDYDPASGIVDSTKVYVLSECSGWRYRVRHIQPASPEDCTPSGIGGTYLGGWRRAGDRPFVARNLGPGCHWFYYEFEDECGNTAECAFDVVVVDDLAPLAVCEEHTVVTLNLDGKGKIYARSIDDGSVDNCMLDTMLVRRMDWGEPCGQRDSVFRDFVEFCCADVGKDIVVEFVVYDKNGNSALCMSTVHVQDKEPPKVVPPDDLTIDCRVDFDTTDLSKVFGKIALSEEEREDIVINGEVYGRDGLAMDNCGIDTIIETVEYDLTCKTGTIKRTFDVYDHQGWKVTVMQIITIGDRDPFDVRDIRWPPNYTARPLYTNCRNGVNTDPDYTGWPTYRNRNCAQIGVNYTDRYFYGISDACYKIERTWTVIDWCQFNKDRHSGIWEHKQVIKVINVNAPTFVGNTCRDTVICDSNAVLVDGVCSGYIRLVGEAEDDCTDTDRLEWKYRLDIGNTGTWGDWVQGKDASGRYPVGTHRIEWSVTDGCGNESTCIKTFELKDCKKPTPVCRDAVVTVLMPSSGNVEVWAKDFNLKSFDNCTAADDLVFSFTEEGDSLVRVFTCDDLMGQKSRDIPVEMWVIDEAGNRDKCDVVLRLQDNDNACDRTGNTVYVSITGILKRVNQQQYTTADIELYDGSNQMIALLKDQRGSYTLSPIRTGPLYTMKVHYDKGHLEGVTTLDLVYIHNHLLGRVPFTHGWQYVAADANNTGDVTIGDIGVLRALILGKIRTLKGSPSWKFYPEGTDLDNPQQRNAQHGVLVIRDLQHDLHDVNWIGIKIGDVSGSINLNGGQVNKLTRQLKTQWTENADGSWTLELLAMENFPLHTAQFTLRYDEYAELLQLTSPVLDINPQENYVDRPGAMLFSWYDVDGVAITKGDAVLKLRFQSKPHTVEMNSSIIDNEWLIDENICEVQLTDGTITSAEDSDGQGQYALLQNIPNPFRGVTIIPFELPRSEKVTLTFRDMQGKVILVRTINGVKGLNRVEILESELAQGGTVLLYEMKTPNFSQVRKMVIAR